MDLYRILKWCQKIRNGSNSDIHEWWFHPQRRVMSPEYRDKIDAMCQQKMAHQLVEMGYVTVPFLSEVERQQYVKQFEKAEMSFREYARDPKDPSKNKEGQRLGSKQNPYVLGGFGAYGNPSSFHNEFVRDLRSKQLPNVVPVFRHLLKTLEKDGKLKARDYKLALLFDRMCRRPRGTSTTKESYHRDLLPTGRPTDSTIGGWIQLSEDPSYLSCQPKTHIFPVREQPTSNKGFATQKGRSCTEEVPVPPGSLLLFFQNMGHCVYSKTKKKDSLRLFSVWLLTTHKTSILDYGQVFTKQGVPRLPSNQKPAMYGGNHASFWLRDLTIPWSRRNFLPAVLVEKPNGALLVDRFMSSLEEYGFTLYPPYRDWEKQLFVPFQRIEIPALGTFSLMEKG